MGATVVHIRLDVNGQTVLESGGQQGPVAIIGKQFRWKGTDADMVELIYGLQLIGAVEVDGRLAEIKEVAELFGNWFGRVIPNVYYTKMVNHRRKKDKTPFLNRLIRALMRVEGEGET